MTLVARIQFYWNTQSCVSALFCHFVCASTQAKLWKDGKMFREIQPNCWSPETRLAECNDAGVTVQVLSTVPVLFNYWAKPADCLEISQFLNDHIADVCRTHPTRFIGSIQVRATTRAQQCICAAQSLRALYHCVHTPCFVVFLTVTIVARR